MYFNLSDSPQPELIEQVALNYSNPQGPHDGEHQQADVVSPGPRSCHVPVVKTNQIIVLIMEKHIKIQK